MDELYSDLARAKWWHSIFSRKSRFARKQFPESMSRFIRASSYRHVYGTPNKKEQCFDNLKVSKNAWDSNLVKANTSFVSVNLEVGGGGSFAVLAHENTGRLSETIPVVNGHAGNGEITLFLI
jgi:hypothetical protein